MQVGANLVALTLTESVALGAAGLEETGTLLLVACQFIRSVKIQVYDGVK